MHYRIAAVSLLCATASVATHAATKQVTYYYTDPQGTVLATADENGNIIERSDYRPFGEQALGSKQDGPGYTGHVSDADTDLVYMQQRYYDPSVGRFLSLDPAPIKSGSPTGFARFSYANNNPYAFIDPDGREAILYWSSSSHVTVTIPYSTSGLPLPFPEKDMVKLTQGAFRGLVNVDGKIVNMTTTLQAITPGSKPSVVNNINVVSNTNGVTTSGRSETNKIGGTQVTLGANGIDAADASTAAHELGHVAGAGDQYKDGIDVTGKKLSANISGDPNIMRTLQSTSANEQTLREIIQSGTNSNTCAPGSHAANGAC